VKYKNCSREILDKDRGGALMRGWRGMGRVLS
jgi:hypothetical protein